MKPLLVAFGLLVNFSNASTTTVSDSVYATTTPAIGSIVPVATSTVASTTNVLISTILSATPLISVARCESGLRQFNFDGTVILGKVNPLDKVILQINTKYHQQEADTLGYDLDTLEGNLKFGRWLYEHQGLQPWSASSDCWSPLLKT